MSSSNGMYSEGFVPDHFLCFFKNVFFTKEMTSIWMEVNNNAEFLPNDNHHKHIGIQYWPIELISSTAKNYLFYLFI
jgi:hypothetical protein